MKSRKKRYLRDSKNYTIYYIDFWGEQRYRPEPFNILFFKYNQYLIDRNGTLLKISEMNDKGYEYSAYMLSDLVKDSLDNSKLHKTILHLENEIKETIKYFKKYMR